MNVKLHDVHFKQYTSFFDNVRQSRLTHQKWRIHHRYVASSFEQKPCKVWSVVLLLCHLLYPHSHELRKQESAVKILFSRLINSVVQSVSPLKVRCGSREASKNREMMVIIKTISEFSLTLHSINRSVGGDTVSVVSISQTSFQSIMISHLTI